MKDTEKVSHEVGARVLIIAYACEPGRGSEPGTGWNMSLGLAEFHRITVVTRANNQPVIEKFMATYSGPRPEFLYVDPAPWVLCLKKRKIVPVQLFYYFWQQDVARIIGRQKLEFDIIHQLTFNSFEVPPLAFQNSPAIKVWGPIGGGQTTPKELLDAYPVFGRLKEKCRSLRVKLSAKSPHVIKTLNKSSLILFANQETRALLAADCSCQTDMLIDVGVDIGKFHPPSERVTENKVKILSVGGLEGRKGVLLLLEAFETLSKKYSNVELRIVGKGPMNETLRNHASARGLENRVVFTGAITHDKMSREFAEADIFAFPSLRDTSGAVVLEAMAMELPVVSFDHQGAALMVEEGCGIRVSLGKFDETIKRLSDVLEILINDSSLRIAMGKAGRKVVMTTHSWPEKVSRIDQYYRELLAAREES